MAIQLKENYLTIPQIDNALKVVDKKINESTNKEVKEELYATKVRLEKAKSIILNHYHKTMKKHPELVTGKKNIIRVIDTKAGKLREGGARVVNFVNAPIDFFQDHKAAIVAVGATIATANTLQHLLSTEVGKTALKSLTTFLTNNPMLAAALGVAAVTTAVAVLPSIRQKVRQQNKRRAEIAKAKSEILESAQPDSIKNIENVVSGTAKDENGNKIKFELKDLTDNQLQEIIDTPGLVERLNEQLSEIEPDDLPRRARIINILNRINQFKDAQNRKEIESLAHEKIQAKRRNLAKQYAETRSKLLQNDYPKGPDSNLDEMFNEKLETDESLRDKLVKPEYDDTSLKEIENKFIEELIYAVGDIKAEDDRKTAYEILCGEEFYGGTPSKQNIENLIIDYVKGCVEDFLDLKSDNSFEELKNQLSTTQNALAKKHGGIKKNHDIAKYMDNSKNKPKFEDISKTYKQYLSDKETYNKNLETEKKQFAIDIITSGKHPKLQQIYRELESAKLGSKNLTEQEIKNLNTLINEEIQAIIARDELNKE